MDIKFKIIVLSFKEFTSICNMGKLNSMRIFIGIIQKINQILKVSRIPALRYYFDMVL